MKLRVVKSDAAAYGIASDLDEDPPDRRPTAEQALQLSIDKWKLIVALRRGNASVRILDGSHNSCGLCAHYYRHGNACSTCPVKMKTGHDSCRMTPYVKWLRDPTLNHAEQELAFLESLREPKMFTRDARGRFASR